MKKIIIKNFFRLYSSCTRKWILVSCRSSCLGRKWFNHL